jgi:hypothetical protein
MKLYSLGVKTLSFSLRFSNQYRVWEVGVNKGINTPARIHSIPLGAKFTLMLFNTCLALEGGVVVSSPPATKETGAVRSNPAMV